MKALLRTNKKLEQSGACAGIFPSQLLAWTIPAARDMHGRVTCPMAGECLKFCYAGKGFYRMPNVKRSHQANYEASKLDNFHTLISAEVTLGKRRSGLKAVRIHTGGDFYSPEYLAKWVTIAQDNPSVIFYCYTKSVKMMKDAMAELGADWPKNFRVVFSYGGKQDHLIDPTTDRHSVVFDTEEELLKRGYADATHDDTVAYAHHNHCIGLVKH